MATDLFPTDGVEVTVLRSSLTSIVQLEIRAFFHDPDGHPLEVSEVR